MGIITGASKVDQWGTTSKKVRSLQREDGSIRSKLYKAGFSDEDIQKELAEDVGLRSVFLAEVNVGGDENAIGIGYSGDYRYEEEAATGHLMELLAKNPQVEVMSTFVIDGVKVYSFQTDGYIYDRVAERNAATAVSRHRKPYNRIPWEVSRMTVAEMRSELKGLVSPLPKKRDEAERAYAKHVLKLETIDTVNVGENHNGASLAIATSSPIQLAVLEILNDLAKENRIGVGSSSNPFSRGMTLYDTAEIPHSVAKAYRERAAWDAQMLKKAEPTVKLLRKSGMVFSVSRPHTDKDRGVVYWLNYSPRGHKQIFGYFTIREMEKFAAGDFSLAGED